MFIYIYKLIKKGAVNNDMVYIGSTKDVKNRKMQHKYSCNKKKNKEYNKKVYKYIRENGGIDEWDMIVIDEIEVPLEKCEQRDKCEDEYIRRYDAINKLNDIYNRRSSRQYYKDNLEKIKEYKYKWRIENKELIKEQNKAYHIKNREKDKQTSKIRYERDKEKRLEQSKLNYEKNIEKIKERTKQKISCDICGSIIARGHKAAHQRTQKCINFKNLAI